MSNKKILREKKAKGLVMVRLPIIFGEIFGLIFFLLMVSIKLFIKRNNLTLCLLMTPVSFKHQFQISEHEKILCFSS